MWFPLILKRKNTASQPSWVNGCFAPPCHKLLSQKDSFRCPWIIGSRPFSFLFLCNVFQMPHIHLYSYSIQHVLHCSLCTKINNIIQNLFWFFSLFHFGFFPCFTLVFFSPKGSFLQAKNDIFNCIKNKNLRMKLS